MPYRDVQQNVRELEHAIAPHIEPGFPRSTELMHVHLSACKAASFLHDVGVYVCELIMPGIGEGAAWASSRVIARKVQRLATFLAISRLVAAAAPVAQLLGAPIEICRPRSIANRQNELLEVTAATLS